MKTILVTASGGSAGRHVVAALRGKGFKVIASARTPSKLAFSSDVEVRVYDANAVADFDTLLQDVDGLVLIAPPLDGRVHEKLRPLISAAAARHLEHIVFISGNYLSGMTGETLESLAVYRVEQQIKHSGLKHTIVRASFFMDNYTTGFYSSMVAQGRISLATADGKMSLVAAADIADFIAEAFARDLTGEYLVTGPQALDHYQVAELLSQSAQHSVTYTPISEEQLIATYQSRGLPAETIQYGSTLYRAVRNQTTAAVTDGFRQATGRDPMTFKEFLGLH
jgi:uncharacterized protein YbjT (DUF2867 family)